MYGRIQEIFSEYGYVLLAGQQKPSSAVTTFSEDWHRSYFENRFFEIDPVFDFSTLIGPRSGATILTPQQMETPLFEEARAHGADSNFVSVSNFGGSKMVFGGVNHDLGTKDVGFVHKRCRELHRMSLIERVQDLTDAQLDVLELSEEGLMDAAIAAELQVSVSAIAQRKRAICQRIGVTAFSSALSFYSSWKWGDIVGQS